MASAPLRWHVETGVFAHSAVWRTAVTVTPTTALVIAASWFEHHALVEVAVAGGWALFLATIASIDARTRIIPNALVYSALGLALAMAATSGAKPLLHALAGGAIAAAPFLIAFAWAPRLAARHERTRRASPRLESERAMPWAGLAGALAVLIAGLAYADRLSAIAAATLVAMSFMPVFAAAIAGERGATTATMRGMGGGDVKLAALLGAIAGAGVVDSLMIAILGAAAAATALVLLRGGVRGSALPYGPFLAGGAVLALLQSL